MTELYTPKIMIPLSFWSDFCRDVDQMSDDLSEGHEDLMDDEVSFFAKSVDEIARITTRMTSSSPCLRPHSSTSVQTVDSDTSLDTSISVRSSVSKAEPTYIEELIPAEGDDPKFDIPPESMTVKEGEPAKFSCRVSGTEPIGKIYGSKCLKKRWRKLRNCRINYLGQFLWIANFWLVCRECKFVDLH